MERSTHQARNADHAEFEATVPDIGPGWPKSMTSSSKSHYYPAPHPRRPTASFRESIRNQIVLMMISRTPKSLSGGALLMHNNLSHKPPTFCLGTSGYAGSPKTPRSSTKPAVTATLPNLLLIFALLAFVNASPSSSPPPMIPPPLLKDIAPPDCRSSVAPNHAPTMVLSLHPPPQALFHIVDPARSDCLLWQQLGTCCWTSSSSTTEMTRSTRF
ncbi:hypothetical protein PIB30_077256 [Stylosanthes scabra]|uniref:Uncharacterized protein n=1 Tax=Stylosanthes scabra TaxID=79078 RepID=A0ABU6WRA1_9FABA|nr:hypothetical protein [Stylosanthes scabra]